MFLNFSATISQRTVRIPGFRIFSLFDFENESEKQILGFKFLS